MADRRPAGKVQADPPGENLEIGIMLLAASGLRRRVRPCCWPAPFLSMGPTPPLRPCRVRLFIRARAPANAEREPGGQRHTVEMGNLLSRSSWGTLLGGLLAVILGQGPHISVAAGLRGAGGQWGVWRRAVRSHLPPATRPLPGGSTGTPSPRRWRPSSWPMVILKVPACWAFWVGSSYGLLPTAPPGQAGVSCY